MDTRSPSESESLLPQVETIAGTSKQDDLSNSVDGTHSETDKPHELHKFQLRKKSPKLKYIFGGLLLLLLVVGGAAAFALTQTGQDLRQQAAGNTYVRCQPGGFCPLGSDCNKATGICVAKQTCKLHSQCPSDRLCSPQGFCELKRSCTTKRGCVGTEICPGGICVACSKNGEGGNPGKEGDGCCPGLKLKQLDKTCNKFPNYTPCPEMRCSR